MLTTSTTSLDEYTEMSKAINLFSKISQIETCFYSFNNALLIDGQIYQDSDEIQRHLSLKETETFSLFPVIAEENVYGFVICDATSVSQERIGLTRTYLENIFNDTIGRSMSNHVQVLNPLSTQNISQIRRFALLFKPTLNKLEHGHNPNNPEDLANLSACSTSIKSALEFINQNIKRPLSLEYVSQSVFLSPSYLSRVFKRELNVNFIDYINSLKIALACEKLVTTNEKVNVISKQVGCAQTSYFSKVFKNLTGMTPLTYRRTNHSVQKIYTIPHDLLWQDSDTVYDASKRFFDSHHISYSAQTVNGYPYINQIGGLADSLGDRGWIYTVDCSQPTDSASTIAANSCSVIQWIYTSYAN